MVGRTLLAIGVLGVAAGAARGVELLPPASQIKRDRPRVLLRPHATPSAISLKQLREKPGGREGELLLEQLRSQRSAAAQALLWRMTGDAAAADRAVERLRSYRYPGRVDTFHIYLRLTEYGLAYDWLYDYPGFPARTKAEVRANILPLAQQGLKASNDHMFHNYIWMSAGGVAIWALAVCGEDASSTELFERIRSRFNSGLFPAWKYLDGLPSEPMGYWALYVYTPGVLAILGAQSAFETDLVEKVKREDGDWLARNFENLVQSTLPDMRYFPWGDLQSGPNGGVTHEMAGIIDASAWALDSPHGAYFSRWLARRRGPARFYGDTAIFYMLYTRRLRTRPETPPLSFMAGGRAGGHFIARSGWDDGGTVVALACTDHLGDHHHYDQGQFLIYRNGLLAVDPPVYRHIRGPQQKTENHNTLLLGGRPQRGVRGQWFVTVEDFQENLNSGRRLETGDMLFWKDSGDWAAASCQFAQAYDAGLVESCVRQLLFLRPGKVLVVDRLAAPPGRSPPEVEWLLQLPAAPEAADRRLWASNGTSWIRCRAVLPGEDPPLSEPTDVGTHRVRYRYEGGRQRLLVHLLEVGDGARPNRPSAEILTAIRDGALDVTVDDRVFVFDSRPPFAVHPRAR